MDRASAGAVAATLVGAASAAEIQDSVLSQLAVIAVGAFGGALFGIMNAPRAELSQSVRDMLVRFLPSMFLSGPMVYAAQRFLPAEAWDTPKVMVLLAVSFAVTSPGELAARFRPLWGLAGRLRAGPKE